MATAMKTGQYFYLLLALLALQPTTASRAMAAITQKDVIVIARIIPLADNGPQGNVEIAVIKGGPASVEDAQMFMELVGKGKTIGGTTISATTVTADQLSASKARVVLIPAGLDASEMDTVFTLARRHKLITISTSEACLRAQKCALSIRSEPAVDIKLSLAAANATGLSFGTNFRMIIKEVP